LPLTYNDELDVHRHDFFEVRSHEINPANICERRQDRHQRDVDIARHFEFGLQVDLTASLPDHFIGRVVGLQEPIGRRIPLIRVHAVDDSAKLVFSIENGVFKAVSEFTAADFFGKPAADGAQHICAVDPGLHEVDLAEMLKRLR